MNVLFLSPTVDTAGLGIGMKRAFDAYGGDWHARHVRQWDSWLRYDADVTAGPGDPVLARLWEEADVLVIIEQPLAASWGPRRPTIVWHLGSFYRRQIPAVHAQCQAIGALEVADMHDLIRRAGYPVGWLPDVIDPKPLAALRRREVIADGRIRIAHAPTDRAIKSTAIIEPAIRRVMARHPEVDFDLIEGVPNAECLVRKARADIFVDELTLGYGLNALESWSMGQPVVSGIADPETRRLMYDDFDGIIPFVEATAQTVEGEIEQLVSDPEYRATMGAIGREHVEKYHTPKAVVERTVALFDRALGRIAA